MAMVIRTLYLK